MQAELNERDKAMRLKSVMIIECAGTSGKNRAPLKTLMHSQTATYKKLYDGGAVRPIFAAFS